MTVASLVDRRREPVPAIVAALRDMLARAESGDLRELIYIYREADGDHISYASTSEDRMRQLGAAERLVYRLHRTMDEAAGIL